MDREQEILSNMGLVYYICSKYAGPYTSVDDMTQCGMIGLIMGVDTYDDSRNVSRSTYYSTCIRHEVYKALRATCKAQKDVSLETVLSEDDNGNTITVADVLADATVNPMQNVYRVETRREVWDLVNTLTDEQRDMLLDIYGVGRIKRSQEDVAERMGIAQSNVSRRKKQILLKLKQIAEERGVYIAG